MNIDPNRFAPNRSGGRKFADKIRQKLLSLPFVTTLTKRRFDLSRLRLSRSVVTALIVGTALILWLVSGILSNNEIVVEAARPLIEHKNTREPFAVTTRLISATNVKREIILQARTEADKLVTLAAETNGTIAALPTDKGAFVKKGQVICQIDIGARQAQLDEARALRDARKIEFNAARKLVEKGHTSQSHLASMRAAYDGAIANVKTRQVELQRTKIRAPFDGIIDTQPVKVGDFIAIGAPCGMIIDKDPILVVAHLAEHQVNSLSVGARGTARLATGEQVTGAVRYIAESPNAVTRTFRTELEVPNKALQLRDGVTAEVRFQAGAVRASRIPQSAMVLNDNGRLGVRVIENDNRVVFRPVDIVSDRIDGADVTGLKDREKVIIIGASFTRAGQIVKAIEQATTDTAKAR